VIDREPSLPPRSVEALKPGLHHRRSRRRPDRPSWPMTDEMLMIRPVVRSTDSLRRTGSANTRRNVTSNIRARSSDDRPSTPRRSAGQRCSQKSWVRVRDDLACLVQVGTVEGGGGDVDRSARSCSAAASGGGLRP